MGVSSELAEDFVGRTGVQIDDFPEREPAEFDCPDCHGPAHCRTECDRRFAARQADIDAWHRVWSDVRRYVPAVLRQDGDALVEPF